MSTSSFWSAISSAASELTGGGSAAAASPLQLTKAAGPVAGQRSVRLRELKDVMRETMRHAVQSPEQPVDELTPSVVKLVRAVERCMFHGVRKSTASGNQGGGSHFWDTVLKLEAADSVAFGSSIAMVRMLRHVNTPRGMCRAWIRMLLNQNSLEYNVGAMVGRNKHHLARSYEPHALVLDPEGSSILHNMFAALNGIGFKLTVDNPTLDQNAPSSAAGATEAHAREGQRQGGALGGGGGGGTAAAATAAAATAAAVGGAGGGLSSSGAGSSDSGSGSGGGMGGGLGGLGGREQQQGASEGAAGSSSSGGRGKSGSSAKAPGAAVVVSGAGLDPVNGLYCEAGIKDGVPRLER
jgi:hypothetical protein